MSETTPAWQDTSVSPRARAESQVAAMSMDQKIAQFDTMAATSNVVLRIRSSF
jgi:hypothetical protein